MGDNNFATLANWSPNLTVPGDLTGNDQVFAATAGSAGGSASTPAAANNDIVGLSINSVTVSGYPGTSTGWLPAGNDLSIGAGGITVSSSTTGKSVILNNNVALAASETWTGSSRVANRLTIVATCVPRGAAALPRPDGAGSRAAPSERRDDCETVIHGVIYNAAYVC